MDNLSTYLDIRAGLIVDYVSEAICSLRLFTPVPNK